MRTTEHDSDALDDSMVEQILNRFFAHEVPEELHGPSAPDLAETRPVAAPRGLLRMRIFIAAGATALATLLAVGGWWLWTPPQQQVQAQPKLEIYDFSVGESSQPSERDPGPVPSGPAPRPSRTFVSPWKSWANDVDYSLSKDVEPVESFRYNTVRGPVEQRTNLNTTKVRVVEPDSGELLELNLPELVIEVRPVEEPASTVPVGGFDKPPAEPADQLKPAGRLPRKR